MRVVSHTCSNTEIVCALGAAELLVAVDSDSDYPPDVVQRLPQLGRDLDLDVEAVRRLQPDLVLTSLTVPGHERIVDALQSSGLRCLVIDPLGLDDVFASVRDIAAALDIPERGERLAEEMDAAMPAVTSAANTPRILVEWWPKPVIGAARLSWVHDLIERAGGINALGNESTKSSTIAVDLVDAIAPDAIVMSWCGVKVDKYRADVVLGRDGWADTDAIRKRRVHPVSEEFLGRPGPRLVDGYRALRRIIAGIGNE